MFYSIPATKRRSYRFHEGDDDEDDEVIGTLRSPSSRRSSLPVKGLAEAETARSLRRRRELSGKETRRRDSIVVWRNRRFSTEAHPSLVCGELLREWQAMDDVNIDSDLEILEMDLDDV
mmetsp:Transcript_6360/g.11625  ORF Transcript_6360/g.11625 Transcript_6360/m.11625 type:complete len:119 (-) Transcript_6360:277-633(-)